jgi:dTDP-glucose 4,6-dehydratase
VRILVAGGAGFIGSRLVRDLAERPIGAAASAAVTVLDLAPDTPALDGVAGVEVVTGDICDAGLVAAVVPGHDAIVNLAAETHVDRSITGPARFLRTNVVGAQTLLDAAVSAGVPTLVQVSTDEVYGPVPAGAAREDAPLAPSSPYSASKAAADLLALAYRRTYGIDVRITRGANTYGPWQQPDKVVPVFVTSLLDGRPAPVYGDGGHVREWVHVDDHAAAIRLVLERGSPGEVYNVGSGERLANRDLAATLIAACGAPPDRVEHVADRPGHDRRYAVDTAKIRALGFAPAVPLAPGLAATARWYAEHRAWWEERKRVLPPHR